MPQGLQVWNADGSIKLDTSTLLGRIFGSINVPAGLSGGVISREEFSQGQPFLVSIFGFGDFSAAGFVSVGPAFSQPNFTVSGNTVTWSRSTNTRETNLPSGVIYYGVF